MVINAKLNTKTAEIKNKIPSITGLATTAGLYAKAKEFENKISDIIGLLTTAPFNKKAAEIENKISDIPGLTTRSILNSEITKATKDHATKVDIMAALKGKINKKDCIKYVFNLTYFIHKSHFNYSVFQPIFKYFINTYR